MPGYNVVGPSEAFANTLEDALLKHTTAQHQAKIQERQAKLDQAKLAQDKAYLELAQKQEEARVKDREETHAEKVAQAKEKEGLDIAARLQMNDVVTPDIAAKLPLGTVNPATPGGADISSVPGTSIPLARDLAPTPATFRGLPAARIAAAKQGKIEGLISQLKNAVPGSPEAKQLMLQYEMETGKSIPSEFFKGEKSETEPVYRVSPDKGTLEVSTGPGIWKPAGGDIPIKHTMLTEPQPRPERPEPQGHWTLIDVEDPDHPGTNKKMLFNSLTTELREAPIKPKAPTKKAPELTPEQKIVYTAALKRRQAAATHWYGGPDDAQQKQIEADALAEAKASSGGKSGLTDAQQSVLDALSKR